MTQSTPNVFYSLQYSYSFSGVNFDQSLFDLESKLENRPTKQDLVSHNIIKGKIIVKKLIRIEERRVAPCIQATQQKLKFNRAVDELDSKVRNRPTRVELLDSNIMKGASLLWR